MDPKLAYQKAVLPVPKLHFVRPSKAGSGFYDSPQVQSFQGSPYFGGFFSIQPDSKTPTLEQDPSYQFIPRQSPSQDDFEQSEPQAPSAQARSSETEDGDYQYENLEIDEYSRPVFKIYDAVPVQ
ncbi:hypothetical protein TCAL_14329 [Tigriopus californicus]|uniref:Uncharacterized protein n=2 Tax=Tigriopus californicus TaxID=6832 RepID=A0A553NEL9_TIGCA|nr:hypothetical protein TCAL_14329 [Tigriopus californicus]